MEQAYPSPSRRRNVLLLVAAVALVGLNVGIFESVFNNYLSEVHHIESSRRGILEFPRELPGFLVALFAGLLYLLSDARAAVVAMAALATGLVGLGYFSPSFAPMVFWMMLWSAGHHLFMPLQQSLGVAMAEKGGVGKRLGQLEGAATVATVAGAAVVWIGIDYLDLSFAQFFAFGALAVALAGAVLWQIRMEKPQKEGQGGFRSRFFFRRQYGVYYLLCVLFGARKQVFLTFGPWMLVNVFGEPASTIAKLWMVASLLGIVFKPALGRLIDRVGERPVLVADAFVSILICLGYGFGPDLLRDPWGLRLSYACFVLDQMLFAVGMARTSYLRRIEVREGDLSPTLSMGVSIDHAASMTVPILGGLIWSRFGYPYVFAAAAAISLVNLFVCSLARVSRRPGAARPARGVSPAAF